MVLEFALAYMVRSICGRIPGFTNAIFPAASMPTLSTVANLGLILFLFLVGLEVDLRFLSSNWKTALSVGALGMALPFGFGAAIAYGLYHQFANEPGTVAVSFGVYLLFIGVAMAITAFPVLCRILTELKLLSTPVGVIVLSAGVGNDIMGWILLALCVALVNAGTGLTALYILLVAIGYTIFLMFAVRPSFLWLLRRSGSLQNGPSQGIITLTLLMVLASSFFTGIIGIHPIFGAFVVGLICPHEGGFAVKVTEKIEDLVCALFLPLYFALSGLSTNLGLLNTGITWAYVIGVICVAFFAKIIGGTLAARLNGLVWRESLTIGVLMSCKGLVELIVLNIGLQAKILSSRTFTIFVVMALATTFATTPLTSLLYPHWYQIKLEAWKRGEIDWNGNRLLPEDGASENGALDKESTEITRLVTCLRIDSMASIITLMSLLSKPSEDSVPRSHPSMAEALDSSSSNSTQRPLRVHGIRLTELTDRVSSIMEVSEMDDEYNGRDSLVNTFKTFGRSRNIAVSGVVMASLEASFAAALTDRVRQIHPDLMLVPWSHDGSLNDSSTVLDASTGNRFTNGAFSSFVASTLKYTTANTAVFIDNGFGHKVENVLPPKTPTRAFDTMSLRGMRNPFPTASTVQQGHHIFLPFFGSDDDKAAVRFVLQVARDPTVTATIMHFELPSELSQGLGTLATISSPTLLSPARNISKHTLPTASFQHSTGAAMAFLLTCRDSLPRELEPRILFEHMASTSLEAMTARIHAEVGQDPHNAGDLVVLGRNAALDGLFQAAASGESSSVGTVARQVLGDFATDLIGNRVDASLLVMFAHSGT